MKLFCLTMLVTVCAPLTFAAEVHAAEPVGNAANSADANPSKPKITISKETTYITEPLRADGYPDYVAALNQRMSQGVTPENNAAVLLLQAFGPSIISKNIRADALKRLGIELPEQGDYIVSLPEMVKRWRARQHVGKEDSEDSLRHQFFEAYRRPWSAEEFPIVVEWLALNEKPLGLVVRAAERSKCYFPFIPYDDEYPPVFSMLLPIAEGVSQIKVLLKIHAMEQIKSHNIETAWKDSMAAHRLARLFASGACLVETLKAIEIEEMADCLDASIAHFGSLSAKQAMELQTELKTLPTIINVVDQIDKSERFTYLDAVMYVVRSGRYAAFQKVIYLVQWLSAGKDNKKPEPDQSDMAFGAVDWDVAIQIGNQWYDRFVKCGRIVDPRERRKASVECQRDLDALYKEDKKSRPLGLMFFFVNSPSKEIAGEVIGKVLTWVIAYRVPACYRAEERVDLMLQMDQTAFALASYHADHGQYPDKLDELIPKYLSEIPDDTFADQPTPVRYRREGEAHMMWTVHLNGIDDDGRTADDVPPGDDWVLRPVPKEKATK